MWVIYACLITVSVNSFIRSWTVQVGSMPNDTTSLCSRYFFFSQVAKLVFDLGPVTLSLLVSQHQSPDMCLFGPNSNWLGNLWDYLGQVENSYGFFSFEAGTVCGKSSLLHAVVMTFSWCALCFLPEDLINLMLRERTIRRSKFFHHDSAIPPLPFSSELPCLGLAMSDWF